MTDEALLIRLEEALARAQNNENDLSMDVLMSLYDEVCGIVTDFETNTI